MPFTFFGRTFGNAVGDGGGSAPAAPVLVVTDNADGTGGVAVVSGSDGGATNTVYSQAVSGELGSDVWVGRGSRTGNGLVALSLPIGYYWFKVESLTAGGVSTSNLVYEAVTDGNQSVLYRCLAAAQARVQSLDLAGISSGSIIVRKIASDRWIGVDESLPFPAIVIAPRGAERMDAAAGTNLRDDISYPVSITILAVDQQDATANLATYTRWREQVARAFRQQRLAGVPEIINTVVEPEPVIAPEAWLSQTLFVSGLNVRFVSREPRGM